MTNKIKMSGLFGRCGPGEPTAAHDHLADTFPEETGNRRFAGIDGKAPSLRELAAKISITALPSGGKMVSGSTDQLRQYITRDIEFTEHMKKRAEIDQIITEALFMQARGRSAPEPRPKPMAMYVFNALLHWSQA